MFAAFVPMELVDFSTVQFLTFDKMAHFVECFSCQKTAVLAVRWNEKTQGEWRAYQHPTHNIGIMIIYLADLIYDTIETSAVIPLNIGYIAATLDWRLSEQIEIKLFKYPAMLEQAIRKAPPDILGLSNYSWNTRLNQAIIKFCKQISPNAVCVMGGPNIRTERVGIYEFLKKNPLLDYYIVHEGEEPFLALVEHLLVGDRETVIPNCATLVDGQLLFELADQAKRKRGIDLPSPYLTGWLDDFIDDKNLIPLLETNRGCPFSCVYCAWGAAALSKVRLRPLEVVLAEIDYIVSRGVKHPLWTICDANFGILPRDVDIAKKIRHVMDTSPYAPLSIQMWASKNSTARNVEITGIVDPDSSGAIAIQSADKDVLEKSGRGKINFDQLMRQIANFRERRLEVATDILIGLPGETANSHFQTLCSAFDFGFGSIHPINIRLLPGTEYESHEARDRYHVKTKFRPIFGCYGMVDGKPVFELEESVRATRDMTEQELNRFKVFHWLISFAWNTGIFKPLLRFGHEIGINPMQAFSDVTTSQSVALVQLFHEIEQSSMEEWFDTEEEMVQHYQIPENFDAIVNNFVKLHFLYTAKCYANVSIMKDLENTLRERIECNLRSDTDDHVVMQEIVRVNALLVPVDIMAPTFKTTVCVSGRAGTHITGSDDCLGNQSVCLEISRDQKHMDFCRHYLTVDGQPVLTEQKLARFFEIGGLRMLRNQVRVIDSTSNEIWACS